MFYSEAKTCLSEKRVAFVGDSRIRQLFYSFVKIIDPERREEGNKVMRISMTYFGEDIYVLQHSGGTNIDESAQYADI